MSYVKISAEKKKNQGSKLRKIFKNAFEKLTVDFEYFFVLQSEKNIFFQKTKTFYTEILEIFLRSIILIKTMKNKCSGNLIIRWVYKIAEEV